MILLGDCIEKLKELEENSVDAVVTDPPYGLSFMGKKWDYDIPSVGMWTEVLRVLKPGGHLLGFGGTRTYHRLASAIEDAGFEIRDQIQWLYGSGFPKSLDISKAIDKKFGAKREVIETIKTHDIRNDKMHAENGLGSMNRYEGWGTALKPANEPIVLARKPLSEKTIAANMIKWGVGGLNIDESRIASEGKEHFRSTVKGRTIGMTSADERTDAGKGMFAEGSFFEPTNSTLGRWPANVLLGCDCEGAEHGQMCAVHLLDEQSGPCKTGGRNIKTKCGDGFFKVDVDTTLPPDNGSGASRFFYVAKASKRERNAGLEGMPVRESKHAYGDGLNSATKLDPKLHTEESVAARVGNQNNHPTVKPIKLMEYLIKLITPPGGVVLDPFMGSGSTGVAAFKNGFKFIGIEMSEEYCEIARKRIEASRSS